VAPETRRSMSIPPGLPAVGTLLQNEGKVLWMCMWGSTGAAARTRSA